MTMSEEQHPLNALPQGPRQQAAALEKQRQAEQAVLQKAGVSNLHEAVYGGV